MSDVSEKEDTMRNERWTKLFAGESGLGLVNAMLALSLLGVFALVAASLAINERRSTFNDRVHVNAFVSADSGGEEAIAWLRNRPRPPFVLDFATSMRVYETQDRTMTAYQADQKFDYAIRMRSGAEGGPRMHRFGNDTSFMDYYYVVDSHGEGGSKGESNVSLVVSRLAIGSYNN
jgi:hypothetical protein